MTRVACPALPAPSLDPQGGLGAPFPPSASVSLLFEDPGHVFSFASELGAVIFQCEKRNKKFRIFMSFVFTPTIFFVCAAFSCACCTVLLPYFATRWLRNEEQRPLKSGRGEKEKEAENWKSRRNQRSEQSSNHFIPDNLGLHCQQRTDTLPGEPVCVSVCVCCDDCATHTHTHFPGHFFHWQGSKPEFCFLWFISMFPDTSQNPCEVPLPRGRIAERRCGHRGWVPAPRERGGEFWGLRSRETCLSQVGDLGQVTSLLSLLDSSSGDTPQRGAGNVTWAHVYNALWLGKYCLKAPRLWGNSVASP